jgi:hypothetical protein
MNLPMITPEMLKRKKKLIRLMRRALEMDLIF